MAKFKQECTFGELIRYDSAYLAAWDSINKSAMYAAEQSARQDISLAEKLELERELARFVALRSLLEASRQGFLARKRAISPPKQKVVEEARKLADQIDELIKQSQAFDQVVSIADKALKLFNRIQAVQ